MYFSTIVWSPEVHARIVEDVAIKTRTTGYDITIELSIPLRYQSHTPRRTGKELQIQLRPADSLGLDDPDTVEQLSETLTLNWNRSSGVPLIEILYEGGDPRRPALTLRFTREVQFSVRNSADFRSLIVSLKTPVEKAASTDLPLPLHGALPLKLALSGSKNEKYADLMDEAGGAMIDEDYRRAIQLYTKIATRATGITQQRARELLGVARERNGQLAHAKAEYETYLRDYPEGPDSDRVRQRLAGLVTATKQPKAKLRTSHDVKGKSPRKWTTQAYGSLSQRYSWFQLFLEDQEARTVQSDLSTDVDFTARARSDTLDVRTQFVGSYLFGFQTGLTNDETKISHLSIDVKEHRTGLYGRIGRQTRSSGGLLGRFDGLHLAYDLTPHFTLNGVYGHPVESTRDLFIRTDRTFYGASLDINGLWEAWDFNLFFINQTSAGILDRRAVGGEVRYFDPRKSLFTLVDYDIFYNNLNIFLTLGNWSVSKNTTLNWSLDYRNNPFLTTTNAIQGQGVETLGALSGAFSEGELFRLAMDRTAKSKTATIGLTHDISENLQIIGEFTATEQEGTPASGGVEAQPGTDTEYFYSAQFILNNLLMENDIFIIGLRYGDSTLRNSYTLTIDSRLPLKRTFRISPKLRIDYRNSKQNSDTRLVTRPILRLDYRIRKWMRLELETGGEFTSETLSGLSRFNSGFFGFVGYRADF